MNSTHNERGFAGILIIIVLAAIVLGAAAYAVQTQQSNKAKVAAVSPSASPSTSAVATATTVILLAPIKSFYTLYDNGSGTPQVTGLARASKSDLITPKLKTYLTDADAGKLNLGTDPVICAQDTSNDPYTYSISKVTDTTASVIAKQTFNGGQGGTVEIGIGLVKVGGSWKLDTLTCVPTQAQ